MTQPSNKTKLIALIGAGAVATLTPMVTQWEGLELRAYRDVVGVVTICYGDTRNVKMGQVATKAECEDRLYDQIIRHVKPVLKCTPVLGEPGRDNQLAAAASLAYNIGPAAYCKSTAARRFTARDWRGGCNAFMSWNKGRDPKTGKLVAIRGLTNRRAFERDVCLRDLNPPASR